MNLKKNNFCVSLDDVEYNTETFHFQDTMKELSEIMWEKYLNGQ